MRQGVSISRANKLQYAKLVTTRAAGAAALIESGLARVMI